MFFTWMPTPDLFHLFCFSVSFSLMTCYLLFTNEFICEMTIFSHCFYLCTYLFHIGAYSDTF